MKELIAACGLDCERCDARKATILNDDIMRERVAKQWSELNKTEIKKEDINCLGCLENGVKSPFCEYMCPIRLCVLSKNITNCGKCEFIDSCEKIKMIISTNKEAYARLKKEN